MACSVLVPGAFAINIPEGTNKLQAAREIDKQYLTPLGLKGKTAAQAIKTLLAEGFRCGLVPVSPLGLNEPPRSKCVKQPSDFGPLCDELDVSVYLERSSKIVSRADLFQQLDTIKVVSALSFCPYPHEVSAEFLGARSAAESTLLHQVHSLELLRNAKSAYDKLLLEGFYCGFAVDRGPSRSIDSPKLVCTKLPSGISSCFESKLVMDIEWPTATNSIGQLFGALSSARVKAVQASCEVPVVKGRSSSL